MVLLAEEEVRTDEVKGWRGLHLLHFGHSLCSRKCRVMLAEKGLEYTSRPVDLRAGENNGEWFMGINPRGLVPVLVHDGRVHIESNDILRYLDSLKPPALFPTGVAASAKATSLLSLEDSVHMSIRTITFVQRPYEVMRGAAERQVKARRQALKSAGSLGGQAEVSVHGQSAQVQLEFYESLAKEPLSAAKVEAATATILACFDKMQALLSDDHPFLAGERLGCLDISVFFNVDRFLSVSKHPLKESHPRLHAWHARLQARPSFAAETENEPADGSPTFTHSQPIKALAAKAMANAATFMQSGWVESACGVAGVQVWRKAASEFYEGYVPPFRSKGTVRGVSPALLMTHILSDDTERQGKRRERNKVEVRCLERVDWQTAVWYERTT